MSVLANKPDSVESRIRSQLHDNPYHALRFISWDYREGILTLHGRLPTYHLKQMAQAAVAGVAGVDEVRNQIEVAPTVDEPAIV
jgi:osmotically-inducible protein OsmY